MRSILLFSILFPVFVFGQDSISVLFIGNSYTYVNDLPTMVSNFSASKGKTITIGSKTNGGYTFSNHVSDPATYTALNSRAWDVVVLQAQSQEPSFPYDQVTNSTLPAAVRLNDSIVANNACGNTLFFMTWGREVGDPQWDSINTFDKMNQRLYQAYMRFADETDAMVSPVGAVWKYVRDNYPAIQLYSGDGSHPSLEGSYLAAATFYTSLFMESPVGATYTAGLNQTTVDALQAAVATVMLDSLDEFKLHPVNAPTQALFTLNQQNENISVSSNSIRATDLTWNFGDGNTGNGATLNHSYLNPGAYTVQLIASSPCNSDTTQVSIEVFALGIMEESNLFSMIGTAEGIQLKDLKSGGLLEMFGISGQLLKEYTFQSNDVLNVSLPTQPVLLKIVFDTGNVTVYRSMNVTK